MSGLASPRPAPSVSAAARLAARPHLLVAGLSLAVSLLFVGVLPSALRSNESSDYRGFYEPVARALLAGRGFVDPNGAPATRYPPGYPLIVAATFRVGEALGLRPQTAIVALNLISAALASLLLFEIARTAWRVPRALLSPFLWITWPLALWLQKQPNSEMPFTVFLFGAVLMLLLAARRREESALLWVACGVFAGVTMLIRPIAIGLGLVLAGVALAVLPARSPRARARAAALLLAGNLLAVLPWEIWAHAHTGRVIPLSTGGVASVRDGLTFAQRTRGFPPRVAALAKDLHRAYPEMPDASGVARVLAEKLAERPVDVLQFLALKAARSWYGTESRRNELRTLLLQLPYLVLGAVSLALSRRRHPEARRLALTITLLIAYFWIMTIAALSIARYMVPAMGLMFAAAPALLLLRRRRAREAPEAPPAPEGAP